jgi:hypothetical protein
VDVEAPLRTASAISEFTSLTIGASSAPARPASASAASSSSTTESSSSMPFMTSAMLPAES